MALPSVIFGPPETMPYEITAIPAAQLAQKGRLPLGTQIVLQDGRKFRFCLAGGTLLVVGNVITTAAIISTDINMTAAAGAIGDSTISYTHGAATTVANYFSEGYVVVSVTPGGGDTYKIQEHIALTSGGTAEPFTLAPGQRLRRALTTTSRVDAMLHPYAFLIQSAATTLTGAPVGVAVSAISATTGTGWLQTAGLCGVLTSGTAVVGLTVGVPLGTAGAAGPIATDTSYPIGVVESLAASTAWSSIILHIDS